MPWRTRSDCRTACHEGDRKCWLNWLDLAPEKRTSQWKPEAAGWCHVCCFWFDLDIYRLVVALDLIESLHHRQRSTGYLVGACFICFIFVVSLDHGKHYPLSGTSSKNQRFMMDFWWFLTHMLHVWNIYQHLPHKWLSHVGKYTIHGAYGLCSSCFLEIPVSYGSTSHTVPAESNTPYAMAAMAAQAPATGLSHRPRPRCHTSVQSSREAIICWMIFPMFFYPMFFPIYIDDFPMFFPIYSWFTHDFSHL